MAGEVPRDLVLEVSRTTGVGAYLLDGAVLGYQSFAVLGSGTPCYYSAAAVDDAGNRTGDWEVGRGTWSAGGVLWRDQVLDSWSGTAFPWIAGTKVPWEPGPKLVALVVPAAQVRQMSRVRVVRETPAGALDGVNATFTLSAVPATGTEEVYLNGLLLESGAGNDYTIVGAIVTLASPPGAADRLKVSYLGA